MQNIRGALSSKYTVPAGQSMPVQVAGEFVRCLEASEKFKLSISGGAAVYFDSGIQWTARSPEQFDEFIIINESANPLTVVMAWGYGEFVDNRLAVSGTIRVDNVSGDKLDVEDYYTKTFLPDIKNYADWTYNNSQALVQQADESSAYWKSRNFSPKTPLTNASFASVNNATTTIVTAGANVNGVIIRHAALSSESSSGGATLKVNGNDLLRTTGGTAGLQNQTVRDIYVPPGWSISATAGAAGYVNVFYEVL